MQQAQQTLQGKAYIMKHVASPIVSATLFSTARTLGEHDGLKAWKQAELSRAAAAAKEHSGLQWDM